MSNSIPESTCSYIPDSTEINLIVDFFTHFIKSYEKYLKVGQKLSFKFLIKFVPQTQAYDILLIPPTTSQVKFYTMLTVPFDEKVLFNSLAKIGVKFTYDMTESCRDEFKHYFAEVIKIE